MKYGFLLSLLVASVVALPASTNLLAADSLPVPIANAPAQSAAQLYTKHCASCHGKDGRSKTIKGKLKHSRDLTDREWHEKVSDERIFNSINNGKGKMPGYAKKLSEEQIESLATYVRALKK
jgi:cytochrome c6